MLERLKDKSHDSPEQGWIVINFKNKPKVIKSTEMVVVDCEMVLCEDETEALEELVKPNKEIADYRTKITGVSSQDLEAVTCSMADIQFISNCCLDDAKAAMDLVLAKIKHGVDKEFPIALVQEHVSKSELAKLLLHKIPNTVNIETLHKILPGDFKIELKLGSVSYEYLNVMRRGLLVIIEIVYVFNLKTYSLPGKVKEQVILPLQFLKVHKRQMRPTKMSKEAN
ncbi:hypothetical protein JHK87_027043 [Glycine soja]|nr:hypothetical protein JHK87_027043 [Glycine soja]